MSSFQVQEPGGIWFFLQVKRRSTTRLSFQMMTGTTCQTHRMWIREVDILISTETLIRRLPQRRNQSLPSQVIWRVCQPVSSGWPRWIWKLFSASVFQSRRRANHDDLEGMEARVGKLVQVGEATHLGKMTSQTSSWDSNIAQRWERP